MLRGEGVNAFALRRREQGVVLEFDITLCMRWV